MSCGVPAVETDRTDCKREPTNQFRPLVDNAVRELMAEKPSLFDGTVIKNVGAYHVGVVRNLEEQNLCAYWDGEEIAVKNSNAFHEQYHVDISSGHVRIGDGAYRATCRPAGFPVSPAPLPQRGDCYLPSSRDMGCDRLRDPQFVQLMDTTAAEVKADRPDLVVGTKVAPANWNKYYKELVDRLLEKGYCAIFDGEEVAIKNTNEFNEQYHPLISSGTVRLGYDAYRATCSPAAF
jgi:hypothetical protein